MEKMACDLTYGNYNTPPPPFSDFMYLFESLKLFIQCNKINRKGKQFIYGTKTIAVQIQIQRLK